MFQKVITSMASITLYFILNIKTVANIQNTILKSFWSGKGVFCFISYCALGANDTRFFSFISSSFTLTIR